ncbi:MAG TPA: polyketide cyclase, partial [Bacillota bacterium]|nr:polyketide cyclase [Bacillota bacterium]
TEGKRINIEIRFERPFKGISDCYMETVEAGNGKTNVKWGFKSSMKYPVNIFLAIFKLEEKLGNDLQSSLSSLKNVLEIKAV